MSGQRRRIAVYGLCFDEAGRVLLVPTPGGAWALPGGTVAHGESPEVAVARVLYDLSGLGARRRPRVRAVLSDQVGAVHHDRIVFEVPVRGTPRAGAWFAPEALIALSRTPVTSMILGLDPDGTTEVDPDDAWVIERGLALDRSGGRPRVQRFSAYGVVTDPAGRYLLTQIAPDYPGAGKWHLPGGGTDFGEAPAAALLRELAEETGQRGRVIGLLSVSHRHNPAAMGWEGYPIDWHTIRVVYRVAVDEPTEAQVIDTGGSTVAAAWYSKGDVDSLDLTDLSGAALAESQVGDAPGAGTRRT